MAALYFARVGPRPCEDVTPARSATGCAVILVAVVGKKAAKTATSSPSARMARARSQLKRGLTTGTESDFYFSCHDLFSLLKISTHSIKFINLKSEFICTTSR